MLLQKKSGSLRPISSADTQPLLCQFEEQLHGFVHGCFLISGFSVSRTVAHLVSEDDEPHLVQCFAGCAELVNHLSAFLAFVYHPLKASYLPLDPPQPEIDIVSGGRDFTSSIP